MTWCSLERDAKRKRKTSRRKNRGTPTKSKA